MFNGAYIIGGIESRDLSRLALSLVDEARAADAQPDVATRSRHVNSDELRQLCERILTALSPVGKS